MKKKKVVLIIMDGWGLAPENKFNAIANAKTPSFDRLVREYPNTRLKSDGLAVGLPEGQFGTSEVNHLTIGAGRVIFQDLPRINMAIEDKSFFDNEAILKTVKHVEKNKSHLHLLGILSDGGVHTHIDHLIAILKLLNKQKFKQQIYLHVFTDGRDVAPKSAFKYFQKLEKALIKLKNINVSIATIQGRSYLDRDRDWDRTETAFKLIAKGEGNPISDWQAVLNLAYATYSTDEQLPQFILNQNGLLKDNDGLIIYHYRTDRLYQIVRRILDEKFKNFEITTFIQASEEFTTINVAFPRQKVTDTLAETIAKAGKSQLHVTETEKFPHLTFFLNGEREQEFTLETWKMFESNRFVKPIYSFEPSMRNFDITKEVIDSIIQDKFDFIVANLSSADMVGHTGNYEAAVVSAESVDYCLGKIHEAIKEKLTDYALIITADHGNSDIMWDYKNKQPHTQHTTSPVPFILVSDLNCKLHRRETLSDIAPTILDLMGIKKPSIMTGESLIIEENNI